MGKQIKTRSKTSAVHSVRCTDELWTRAKRRADHEGVSMNFVVSQILEGYAAGLMDLPTVSMEFTPTKSM